MPHVVVIGAGIGGLVAALTLIGQGIGVTVVEAAATPGGKLRRVTIEDRRIDVGPTVFTLRSIFDAIFAAAGTRLEAHLTVKPARVLARHAWRAGEWFDLDADLDTTVEAIGRFSSRAEGERYRDFCMRARRIHGLLDRPFIRAARPSLPAVIGAAGGQGLGAMVDMAPFGTLWRALGRHFHDPRLRQLFGRYATYCGASPFRCPATLMLVAHVEQAGVWLIEGGMGRLAEVLAELAAARGVVFRYGSPVASIRVEHGRATGVALAEGEAGRTGEPIAADAVICNADVAALAAGLFGEAPRRAATAPNRAERSLSAVTTARLAVASGFPLLHHSVFFSQDYTAEFDDLFGRRRLPVDPTVYLCAQDRGAEADGGRAGDEAAGSRPAGSRSAGARPAGSAERLFSIVNAPADGDLQSFDASEIAQCEERTFRTLERCGLTLSGLGPPPRVTTPADFARLFPATGGALYGAASHGWRAAFRRPGNRSRVPGLYLCGGSVHPGPGVPMAALSGRSAAASLVEDWASTQRWRAMVTLGGISTD